MGAKVPICYIGAGWRKLSPPKREREAIRPHAPTRRLVSFGRSRFPLGHASGRGLLMLLAMTAWKAGRAYGSLSAWLR